MNRKSAFSFASPFLAIGLVALAFPSAAQQTDKPAHGPAVVPSYMDPSVHPGNDFYDYANGGWEKNVQMRPDRAYESPSSDLYDEHDKKLLELVNDASKSQDAESRRIADLYNAYMDEAGIEAAGLTPLQPHLHAIAAIKDKRAGARAGRNFAR